MHSSQKIFNPTLPTNYHRTTNYDKSLIKELIETNCIKVGNFQLKNGDVSKYYFDMKNIISYPKLLSKIGDLIYEQLDNFDIICGIPYGGLPISLYISTKYNKPLIFLRDKVKEYGTQKLIEGQYKSTDKCVIIDDVITTGKSLQETINKLKNEVNIVDIAVIFNRQQNYECSLPVKSLLYKNDVIKYRLYEIRKTKNSQLCFSADIEEPEKLFNIIEKIGDYIVICKIHYDIINDIDGTFKKKFIDMSIKYNFLIMEDRKFNDISYIVNKQYKKFCNWVDLVTVHSLVNNDVLSNLSGVLLVSNMSNNNYDFTDKSLILAENNLNNVVGFITQKRINYKDLVCMTPGISNVKSQINDQKYRTHEEIDTDFIIVGRAIYNSNNLEKDIVKFLSIKV